MHQRWKWLIPLDASAGIQTYGLGCLHEEEVAFIRRANRACGDSTSLCASASVCVKAALFHVPIYAYSKYPFLPFVCM